MVGGLAALHATASRPTACSFSGRSDTLESLSSTADFAVEHRTEQHPVPGPYAAARHSADGAVAAEGRIFTKNWSLYDGHHMVFWPKQMTPFELQMAILDAHKRFYRGTRILPIRPGAPLYRKHRLQGYLMSRAWEHVGENRDYLRELKIYSESTPPPFSQMPEFSQSHLETAVR